MTSSAWRRGSSIRCAASWASAWLRTRFPAASMAFAARSSRAPRASRASVSEAARSRAAAPAPKAPRARARAPARSSSSAITSSSPTVAAARCHARRSGSESAVRERGVHAPPLGRVGAVVGGGPDEGMTELEPVRLDVQQSQRLDLAEIPLGDPQRAERAEHDTGGAGAVRRSHDGRQTAAGGEGREPRSEGALEAVRRRDRVRERLGSGELAGRQQVRQLDERERVPVSGIEDPHQHLRRNPSFVLGQHPSRVFTVEWADRHDLQTGHRRRAGPLGGNEDRGDTGETPRCERERVARRRIDPLQIVDDDQRRAVLGSCARAARASRPRRRNDRRPRADRARARSTARRPAPPGARRGDAARAAARRSALRTEDPPRTPPRPSRGRSSVPACSTRPRSSVVLPMPGSPTSTKAAPAPARAEASAVASLADSTSRPISIFRKPRAFPGASSHGALLQWETARSRGWCRRPGTASREHAAPDWRSVVWLADAEELGTQPRSPRS